MAKTFNILFDLAFKDGVSNPLMMLGMKFAGLNTNILKSKELMKGLGLAVTGAGIYKAGEMLLKGAEALSDAAKEINKSQLSLGFTGASDATIKALQDRAKAMSTGRDRVKGISYGGAFSTASEFYQLFGGGERGKDEASAILPTVLQDVSVLRARLGISEEEGSKELFTLLKARETRAQSADGSVDPVAARNELNSALSVMLATNGKADAAFQQSFIQNLRGSGVGLTDEKLASLLIFGANFAGSRAAAGNASEYQTFQGNHMTGAGRKFAQDLGWQNAHAIHRMGDTIGGNFHQGKGSAEYGDHYSTKAAHGRKHGHGKGQSPYVGSFEVTDPTHLTPAFLSQGPLGWLQNHPGTQTNERDYFLSQMHGHFGGDYGFPAANAGRDAVLTWQKKVTDTLTAAGFPRITVDSLSKQMIEAGSVQKDVDLYKKTLGMDKYGYAAGHSITLQQQDAEAQDATAKQLEASVKFTQGVGQFGNNVREFRNAFLAAHPGMAGAVQPAMAVAGVAGMGVGGVLGAMGLRQGLKFLGGFGKLFGMGGGAAAAGEAGGAAVAGAEGLGAVGAVGAAITAPAWLPWAIGAAAVGAGGFGIYKAGQHAGWWGHDKNGKPNAAPDLGKAMGLPDPTKIKKLFDDENKLITTGWDGIGHTFNSTTTAFYANAQKLIAAEAARISSTPAPANATTTTTMAPIILNGRVVAQAVVKHTAGAMSGSKNTGISTHDPMRSPIRPGVLGGGN